MTEQFETPYGTVHLTQERYKEFLSIVNKHTTALLLELKEHKIVPSFIALQKTSIRELDDIMQQDKLR